MKIKHTKIQASENYLSGIKKKSFVHLVVAE
jgi:hypothetical protein